MRQGRGRCLLPDRGKAALGTLFQHSSNGRNTRRTPLRPPWNRRNARTTPFQHSSNGRNARRTAVERADPRSTGVRGPRPTPRSRSTGVRAPRPTPRSRSAGVRGPRPTPTSRSTQVSAPRPTAESRPPGVIQRAGPTEKPARRLRSQQAPSIKKLLLQPSPIPLRHPLELLPIPAQPRHLDLPREHVQRNRGAGDFTNPLFSTLTRHEASQRSPERRSEPLIEPRSDALDELKPASTGV